ncbi:MAG TPA: AI-2E family transporter [Ktedonobacterales bacterium]|nr:AI-2E family transporter [Ktedonobacterales bacterium]
MHRDLLDRYTFMRVLVYTVTLIATLYAAGLAWSAIMHFGKILLIFLLAWVMAFILQPAAMMLERVGVQRRTAVSLIYLALGTLAIGGIVLAIPTINQQVTLLAKELANAFAPDSVRVMTDQAVGTLRRLGLTAADARHLVNQVTSQMPKVINSAATSAVATSTSLVGAVAEVVLDVILVLILSFYIMLDGDRLTTVVISKLPPAWIPDTQLLRGHIDTIFGGYLRAQLIIAAVYGALTWLVLALVGQANGFVFALIAAVLMLIPFIGPFLAIVPPLMLVLLQAPGSQLVGSLVLVLALLIVAQQITMQIIAPRVMSAQVGLHPLVLFAALLVGARESGAWGALFAVPIAAVLLAMLDTFFERFQRRSALYPDVAPAADTPDEGAARPA